MPSSYIRVEDKGWDAFAKAWKKLAQKKYDLEVGYFSNTPRSDGLTNAFLAAIHEFGSSDGKIPERSFMRSTFNMYRAVYAKYIKETLLTFLRSKTDEALKVRLGLVGDKIVADIKKRVNDDEIQPENTAAWAKRKERKGWTYRGQVVVLRATGKMIRALKWRIRAAGSDAAEKAGDEDE